MQFQNVVLEAIAYRLPSECVTSEALETQLDPLYQRLKLPRGRLELMTGIRQRRFWSRETNPGDESSASGRMALETSQLDPQEIGALIHASVCRDQLEPATACRVHHELGLRNDCLVYDVSNACLGVLNGMLQVAAMIELGQIRAGLVVGSEGSRQLVETTINHLNTDESLTRKQIKPAMASLTIGSASCAVLLVDRELSTQGTPLGCAVSSAYSSHHNLCLSDHDQAGANMAPLMQTDAERLMEAGVEAGRRTYHRLIQLAGWGDGASKTICHQVGTAHRRALIDALCLDADGDFASFPVLGNTGSAALPVTLGLAVQSGHLATGDRLGLLGIGSGINVVFLAAEFDKLAVSGSGLTDDTAHDLGIEVVDRHAGVDDDRLCVDAAGTTAE